jgi:C1A family cysteine protease
VYFIDRATIKNKEIPVSEQYYFGYEPDPPDDRDFDFSALSTSLVLTSSSDIDLRQYASPVQHQGSTNSCVAQSTVSAFELARIRKYGREAHVDLSRLQLYFYMREMRGGQMEYKNVGGFIRHAMYVMKNIGCAAESFLPWDPSQISNRPPLKLLMRASEHRTGSYYKITATGAPRVSACVEALNGGYGVAFGTRVGQNWKEYRGAKGKGVLHLPEDILGGHATLLVGFKDGKFIGQNSWGTAWGDKGFYYLDPSVISSSRSRDFWVVTGPWEPAI